MTESSEKYVYKAEVDGTREKEVSLRKDGLNELKSLSNSGFEFLGKEKL